MTGHKLDTTKNADTIWHITSNNPTTHTNIICNEWQHVSSNSIQYTRTKQTCNQNYSTVLQKQHHNHKSFNTQHTQHTPHDTQHSTHNATGHYPPTINNQPQHQTTNNISNTTYDIHYMFTTNPTQQARNITHHMHTQHKTTRNNVIGSDKLVMTCHHSTHKP